MFNCKFPQARTHNTKTTNIHIIKARKYFNVIKKVNILQNVLNVKVLNFYHFGKTLTK
jgi:hypothetical protein